MTIIDLVLVLTGIATGFLNVMAGGGSMLSVPMMIFLGIPGPIANGTNRIAILPQNLSAVIAFFRQGFADFKLSFSLALCTIPGAVAGAFVATKISLDRFNYLLAVIMIIIMILMWLGDRKPSPQIQPVLNKKRLLAGHLLMVLVGFWGGFIQIGVGFILMPVLHRVMGLDLLRTNMHKVFIVMVFTLAALMVFANQLDLDWRAGVALAVGTSLGGWLAANFQIKQGVGMIRLVLNVVLIVFVSKLLLGW